MDDPHVSGIAEADSDKLIDRLSELPDSLILHILSLLPIRDVAPTTLLSKRWKDLWTTVPGLDFLNPTDDDLDKFPIFFPRFLAHWRGAKILKFSFTFKIDLSMAYLDSLLHFAIEKKVEELHIELPSKIFWNYLESYYQESDYYVPHCLYSCSSITKLTLVSFKLNVSERVRWNQLKSLTLQGGVDCLIEQAMNHILSGSPRLEVLNLCIWENGENLNIESTSLKMLKIDMYPDYYRDVVEARLRIRAPNLQSLEVSEVSYGRCSMNVSSLTSAILRFPRALVMEEIMLRQIFLSVCHVEKISFTDFGIKVLLQMKEDMLVFPNAEYLKFKASEVNEILGVVEMFPKLMMLTVELNNSKSQVYDVFCREPITFKTFGSEPKTIPHNTSSMIHLKTVEISWHALDAALIPCLEFLLGNSPSLEKMVLRLRWRGCNRKLLYLAEEKVLSLPRSSPTAEVIIIKD